MADDPSCARAASVRMHLALILSAYATKHTHTHIHTHTHAHTHTHTHTHTDTHTHTHTHTYTHTQTHTHAFTYTHSRTRGRACLRAMLSRSTLRRHKGNWRGNFVSIMSRSFCTNQSSVSFACVQALPCVYYVFAEEIANALILALPGGGKNPLLTIFLASVQAL